MKYYLIKANDMKKTEFIGEYYFDLQQEPIELTKEELEIIVGDRVCGDIQPIHIVDKIRKVLE